MYPRIYCYRNIFERHVTTDNVWSKPDYQAMIREGIPSDVAYYSKLVRDSLDARPACDRFFIENGYGERSGSSYQRYDITEKCRGNPVVSNKLYRALLILSEKDFLYSVTKKAEKEQFGVPKEQRMPRGYEVRFNDGACTWSKKDDWEADTWYVTKGRQTLKQNLPTRDAAVAWSQLYAHNNRTAGGKERFVPQQLRHIQRDGPDYRSGRDVNERSYLDRFGFRGGEFGNWMNDKDRQASLNYGYDALLDLADTLKIADRDISYNGVLAIAFGARGAGTFAAHYEPDRKVINLTKMRGAGSLAHEWWHGLDDYLGVKLGATDYLSNSPRRYAPFAALLDTVKYKLETPENAARWAEEQHARYLRSAEGWMDRSVLPSIKRCGNERDLWDYAELKEAYLRGEEGSVERISQWKKSVTNRVIPKEEREQLGFYEHTLRSYSERREPPRIRIPTEYLQNSKEMGKHYQKNGGYWESDVELTARAFATYTLDRLPLRSDYLAGHAESAVGMVPAADGGVTIIRAFPRGEEREAINAAFDHLFLELKKDNILTHDQRSRVAPMKQEASAGPSSADWDDEKWKQPAFEQLSFGGFSPESEKPPGMGL